jgi:hypothetical protein
MTQEQINYLFRVLGSIDESLKELVKLAAKKENR